MPKKGYKQTEEHKRKHLLKTCGIGNGKYCGEIGVDTKSPRYKTLVSRRWTKNNLERARELWKRHKYKHRGSIGKFKISEWNLLLKSFGNKCLRCGVSGEKENLQVDHIIPVSLGGTSYIENLQPLCGKCNRIKWNKTIDYRNT